MLATANPAGATDGPGRWPAYWVDLFAQHRWRFTDLIRPALWDDPRFGPDAKEGWLVFVAPGAFPQLPASPPTAMLHPDRITEVVRGVEAEIQQLRSQFLDRLRHVSQRREVEGNRQRLVEAMELIDTQRQQQAAFDARLVAAERRTLQMMEQQLGLRTLPVPAACPPCPRGRGPCPRGPGRNGGSAWPPESRNGRRRRWLHRPRPAVVALFDAADYRTTTPRPPQRR